MPPNSLPATLLFVPRLRAMLEEGRDLGPEDYIRRAITMRVALTTTTTSDTRTYQVPSTHKLLIAGVRGHLMGMISTDAAWVNPTTTAGVSTPRDLALWKGQNCRISLTDEDSTNILGEGQATCLASILAEAGGQPLDWRDAPRIVAPGVTLTLTATLISAAAGQVGSSTEYGVQLDGILIRTKQS